MKIKQGLCATLLSTLVSFPAMAHYYVGDIYASGKFGYSWQELRSISNSSLTLLGEPTVTSTTGNVFAYGGSVGFRWNGLYTPIRTEVDYTFRNKLNYDAVPVYTVLPANGLESTVQNQTILGNLILDIPIINMLGLFVGAGAGLAYNTTQNELNTPGPIEFDSTTDDTAFAWMATAGLSVTPINWLAIDLSYRYSDLGSVRWSIGTTDLTSNNYTANEIFLALRFTIPQESHECKHNCNNQYKPKVWKEPPPQPKPVTKAPVYKNNNKAPSYNKSADYKKSPNYSKERAMQMKDK